MSKPLGLVLILTAHMVFNGFCCHTGLSQKKITGSLGDNITLEFSFNFSVTTGIYWASLYVDGIPKKSIRKELDVRVENRSTVTPKPTNITLIEDSGSAGMSFSPFLAVLLVSSVVLLAAVLPLLIWCILKHKDKQPAPAQQSSNPTAQETVASIVPAPTLVYSVLDFPKRTSAVMEMNSSQTEYAAISYLPEKRQGC
ncbi:hypothetical protein CesoFtcFv8_004984 [Champsocephalus esox]|nr:hypothetical protein CesoFtcFv8_004984 [Champsocephalus esox]